MRHTIEVRLSAAEAAALLKFTDRVGMFEYRANSYSEEEAHYMRDGIAQVRVALKNHKNTGGGTNET